MSPHLPGRAPDLVFVAVLIAVGAVPLWPIYESRSLVIAGVGAMLIGGAVAVIGAARSLPAYAVAAVAAVAFLLFGVPLAVPTQTAFGAVPTASGLRSLVFGIGTGWKQMLSVDLPLGDYEALLVPTFVVLLVASTVGISIALRSTHPGWAILSPIAVVTFAIAFGARTGQHPVPVGIALAVIALLWAAWSTSGSGVVQRAGATKRRSLARKRSLARLGAAAGLVLACSVAGGAVVGGGLGPQGSRDVLRAAVQPPFDPHHYVSPLVAYRNSVLSPAADTAMLTVRGLPSGARVRVATLDDYDGQVFAQGSSPSSGTFSRVASTIDPERVRGRSATIDVTIDAYAGVWMPTVGAMTSISFTGDDGAALRESFFYDRATTSAAVLGGVSKGDRYTLTAVVPTATAEGALARAVPGDAVQPPAPAVPKALASAADKHLGGAATPGEKLVAVAAWLRQGYVSDAGPGEPFSAAGHSAGRLAELATADPMLGDAEQYAPALALLARRIGFPSRVVLGYAPTAAQRHGNDVTLTGADLTAWVEVQTDDGRWLTVDPNPKVRPVPDDRTTQSEAVAQPQTVLPPPPPTRHDTAVTQNRDSQKTKHPESLAGWLQILLAALRVAGVVALIAAIVLAPLWGIALARRLRRRRRLRQDRDDTSLTGAWAEILDDVVDRGYTVPRAATRYEVAALTGSPDIGRLAETAERSVFSSAPIDRTDVDDFWRSSREAAHRLGDGESGWSRLRYHLNARSLVGRLRTAPSPLPPIRRPGRTL